jgi:hypothetical protein
LVFDASELGRAVFGRALANVKFPGQSRVIHRTASGDMSTLDAAAWVLACGFHDCISLAEPQASRVAHGMFIGRNGPQPKPESVDQ